MAQLRLQVPLLSRQRIYAPSASMHLCICAYVHSASVHSASVCCFLRVAQAVGEGLEIVGRHPDFVVEDVVVSRATRTLKPTTTQIHTPKLNDSLENMYHVLTINDNNATHMNVMGTAFQHTQKVL